MEEKQTAPMVTLTPESAHNALAAAIQMYQGILQDHARQLSMAHSAVRAAKAGEQAADQKIKALEQELQNAKRELALAGDQKVAVVGP